MSSVGEAVEEQQIEDVMLKPLTGPAPKLKTDGEVVVPQQSRGWSSGAVGFFWAGVILLAITAGVALGLSIRSNAETHELENGQRSLSIQIEELTNITSENVTTLQALGSQIALLVNDSGTLTELIGPGVALGLTVPGNALVFRLVPDPNPTYNDVSWDFALWDDANYWSSSMPGQVFPPATGRYAVGLNCPTCCELDTTTSVEGRVTIVYSTATEAELHCPRIIASEPIRATNPTDSVPAVSLYAEFELTAGTGEFLAVEVDLNYSFRKRGGPTGGNDDCTFTVRYLGQARGTPMVPQTCVKRRDKVQQ
jgi:hypothetical protein